MSRFLVAALGALATTAGDLSMLYVVNAQRPEMGLEAAAPWLLPLSFYLGVLGVPFYAVGYAALASRLAPETPRASRVILVAGTIVGVLGAVLHGVIGVSNEAQLRAGAEFPGPIEDLLVYGEYIVPLAVAVMLAGAVAASTYVYVVARGKSSLPRWAAAVNPLSVMVVLVIASSGSTYLEAFLGPASPNLAHLVFFLFLARSAGPAKQTR
ncbi:MAG: hypothetical protein DRJ42_19950 [Deltaproteobacteria bacterium]|nr:MAG: hypothetical protein DRJ42_19950 [Deltaproteobacteria bacterium]